MNPSEKSTQKWALDVEGQIVGHFTKEQIKDLLQDGEVLLRHKVSQDQQNWITVQELIEPNNAIKHDSITPTPTAGFSPPERPADLEELNLSTTIDEKTSNSKKKATSDLFNTLQIAKEKNQSSQQLPAGSEAQLKIRPSKPFIFIAIAIILIGLLIWAVSMTAK